MILDLGDFGDAVVSGGWLYAFTSEQRVRISTLRVTPTHVGVSGGEPMPLVDPIEVAVIGPASSIRANREPLRSPTPTAIVTMQRSGTKCPRRRSRHH
jgi:hypothetical protein